MTTTDLAVLRLSERGAMALVEEVALLSMGDSRFSLVPYPSLQGRDVAYSVTASYSTILGGDTLIFPLQVSVSSWWQTQPPRARSTERFIRHEKDWHVLNDKTFCWVHPNEWADTCRIADGVLSPSNARRFLANRLISAVSYLIGCHRLGEQAGIRDWPEEWQQYSHDTTGTAEYARRREEFCAELYAWLKSQSTDVSAVSSN